MQLIKVRPICPILFFCSFLSMHRIEPLDVDCNSFISFRMEITEQTRKNSMEWESKSVGGKCVCSVQTKISTSYRGSNHVKHHTVVLLLTYKCHFDWAIPCGFLWFPLSTPHMYKRDRHTRIGLNEYVHMIDWLSLYIDWKMIEWLAYEFFRIST